MFILRLLYNSRSGKRTSFLQDWGLEKDLTGEEKAAIKELEEMGAQVFYKNQKGKYQNMSWSQLGGYESQKRKIEDVILMALKYPGKHFVKLI